MNRFFIKQLVEVLKKIKDNTASTAEIEELWTYCEKTFAFKIEAKDSGQIVSEAIK